ncbi:DUF3987 domain-containing protein [Burkholderia oklahomensis]|uniref:DUF3987 domain-containing protein n=1 Tax=Burkholderia oklahomensis TaxID=342113 RepID=UPI00264F4F7E|nr:DUF3987 domain-containing protein [Burkholderia oklahomensis]MDN7676046.1 DUF3987 domain-containing protein [Burkholderia oklahomensis]
MTDDNNTSVYGDTNADGSAPADSLASNESTATSLVEFSHSTIDVSRDESREHPRRPSFPTFEPENESFPWQALPETIRAAVIEICLNDKVAVPIAVQAVMSAVSLACQDLIWIDRGIGEKSVCSLYMLAVTDTGARKSRADSTVTSAVEAYDREKRAEHLGLLQEARYSSKERQRNIVELEKGGEPIETHREYGDESEAQPDQHKGRGIRDHGNS